jgi:hypothetical protein
VARGESAQLVKSAALTVALLLAAAALWVYTGDSGPSGGGSGGEQSSEAMSDFTLSAAAKDVGDSSAHAHRHPERSTRPAVSRHVAPLKPPMSRPAPPGGISFARGASAQPVNSSPVRAPSLGERTRRPAAHPHAPSPRRVPKPRAPAKPAPAPRPAPKAPPSADPPPGGAPSDPGAPGVTPTDPGVSPADPGVTPAPVPAADPEAPLDDTPAGELDQSDLGDPIDETPDPGSTAAPA